MIKRRRTELLLFLSVLFLVGAAILLRVNGRTDNAPSQNRPGLVVHEVQFKRAAPLYDQESGMNIKAFLDYNGPKPAWWGRSTNSWLQNIRFISRKGKVYKVHTYGGGGGHFDKARQQYVLEYRCAVPKSLAATEGGTFLAAWVMKDGSMPMKPLGFARFSAIVHTQDK
jgi:hypothetical protein